MTTDKTASMDRRQMLALTAGTATYLLAPTMLQAAADQSFTFKAGRGQPFNAGWRFHLGEGAGFDAVDVDDSKWRTIDLPHDWSIEDLPDQSTEPKPKVIGPFKRNAEGGTATGFSVGGEGWYRKRFQITKPPQGRVELLFEGAYMNSEVWLNGQRLGANDNGYTPFAYDLTPHLVASGDNVIALRIRNLGRNTRWYSGSGLYRSVWLDVLPEQTRIRRWGVGVVTRRIVKDRADIEVTTAVDDVSAGLTIFSRITDVDGRIVSEQSSAAATEVKQSLSLASPHLWSPDKPALYTLETELRRGANVVDRATNTFGVRIVTFDAVEGMAINGVHSKLRGGCIHHDHGLLGAASFDAAEERKVELLKTRGFNAVRPSHNPFSPAFLSACDRLGMMVIAETFDVWSEPKEPQDYAKQFDARWCQDLTSMVLSARNHPSIIMWSIGNEIPGRNTPRGVETQWQLANEVHRLDSTRPVTAALNGFIGRPVTPSRATARPGLAGVPDQTSAVFLDVVGYNYKFTEYETDHARFPKRILFGSESFPKDMAATWDLIEKSPWLLGDFVWTAMDYLGEAGIGGSAVVAARDVGNPLALMSSWPWVNAFCGDLDLIGQQKAQSLARDVTWGVSPLEIVVQRPLAEGKVEVPRIWGWPDEQQSWTWPGEEGRALTVRVYTVGDRVELRLNGRTLESKAVVASDLKKIEFSAPYEPGTLEAVAFRGAEQVACKSLTTVGAPVAIRVVPESPKGGAARSDVHFAGIEIVDSQGRVVPGAAHSVQLSLSGAAELIAFGSANPLAAGSFQSHQAQTWNGRALAIVRSVGRSGKVNIEARADGLRRGSARLRLA